MTACLLLRSSVVRIGFNITWLTFPADTYEIFAWAAESRSVALGTIPVRGVFVENNRNLREARFNYAEGLHFHSAQFYDSNAQRGDYWQQLLQDMQIEL